MTETQERFLRAVLTRVPLDSVVEMHLFPPIRRGTLETGVAVIATALPPEPLVVITPQQDGELSNADDQTIELTDSAVIEASDEGAEPVSVDDLAPGADESTADTPEAVSVPWATEAIVAADTPPDSAVAAPHDDSLYATGGDVTPDAVPVGDDTAAPHELDDTDADARIVVGVDIGDAVMHVESGGVDEPLAQLAVPWPRMRIFTASYRHTIKGVDRGKWTFDVHEEADAPLEAVELVLRGVRHRSTEPADPEQVSHDALTALVTPARVAPAA